MQTKHWYRNCGGASWIQDVARSWSEVTCVSCCESAVEDHRESPNQFLVGAVDRLRALTAQSPPARWHIDAWLKGGCVRCGDSVRRYWRMCEICNNQRAEGEIVKMDAAIKAAGYLVSDDPRPGRPAPSKQEPTRGNAFAPGMQIYVGSPRKIEWDMSIDWSGIVAARDALLTRCITFLNDVGISEQRAMSTARNNERAQLVRDIKEAIVPADKKR